MSGFETPVRKKSLDLESKGVELMTSEKGQSNQATTFVDNKTFRFEEKLHENFMKTSFFYLLL